MFFKQRVNDDASISYFFGCAGQGKGIAVDVLAQDEGWYIEQARRLGVAISFVFDTHIHADHLSGGRKLAALAGAAYVLHESNAGKTGFPFTAAMPPRPAGMERLVAANLGQAALAA